MVCVDRVHFLAHRVIWEMVKGAIPNGMIIDHIDRNPLNNRIDNLRLVTRAENQRNLSMSKKNASGYNGVSWSKPMNKWRVRIKVNGKEIVLGYFDDPCEAGKVREQANTDYGFQPTHGKKVAAPKGAAHAA
jgi:hypothetical protein